MKYCRLFLAALLLTGGAMVAQPAEAGIFSKRAKANPAERVPALIATLRAEQDEHKRASAAEELRQYDPAMFPEIIPTLADIAQRDPKSSVRLEAIQSLAKLRPVSQRAGAALEQATHDEAMRVRLQARTLLWQYHLAGYHGAKTPDISAPVNTIRTEEPPLAPPLDSPPVSAPFNGRSQSDLNPSPMVEVPASRGADVVASPPTIGFVAPVPPATPKANIWGAAAPPKPLPASPVAVPLGPRPLPAGPAQAQTSGPKPLPSGPAKTPDNGPKPLPSGPVDAAKPTKDGTSQESPQAPSQEEGPDLPPP